MRGGEDFAHGGEDEGAGAVRGEADAARVEARDGADGVQAGVVDEFAPAREGHVGRVGAGCFCRGRVEAHEVAGGGGFLEARGQVGVVEGADYEGVVEVVFDFARERFVRADHADAGEEGGGGEGGEEGGFDVQAVLEEEDGCVGRGYGGADEGGQGRGDVRGVFGGED